MRFMDKLPLTRKKMKKFKIFCNFDIDISTELNVECQYKVIV
jgi:hypothetical protein